MNKFEPYFNPIMNIFFFIVVFILFGIFMYAAIVLTDKYHWLQVQFGALWFLGFLITLSCTLKEIGEISRIKKLEKKFRGEE